jgi:hypothetical protein
MEWKNASSESLQRCLVRKLERKSGKIFTDENAYCYVSNLFYIARSATHARRG